MKLYQDTSDGSSRLSWLILGGVAAALIAVLVVVLIVMSSSTEPASELRTDSSVVTSSEESRALSAEVPVGDVVDASDGSFRVLLPKGWRSVRPETEFLLTLYSRNDESNMLVMINPATTRGPTIFDSANDTLGQAEREFGGDLVVDPGGVEATTVGGEPAVRFTYSFVGDKKARGRQLFVRHNDIEYIVTYTGTSETFDDHVAEYEQIQNTWTWTE